MTRRDDATAPASRAAGWLSDIERIGNRLPDPSTLFLLGTLLVLALSQIAVTSGWSVEKQVVEEVRVEVRGADGAPVVDPRLAGLRNEPRYQRLMERVGLPR